MNTVTCGSHSQESSDKVSWQIWRDIPKAYHIKLNPINCIVRWVILLLVQCFFRLADLFLCLVTVWDDITTHKQRLQATACLKSGSRACKSVNYRFDGCIKLHIAQFVAMFLGPKFFYLVSKRVDQCNGLHIAQSVAAVTTASVSAMASTSKSPFTSVSVSLTFLAFTPASLSTSVLTSVLSTFLTFHEDPHAIFFCDQRDFLVATDALFSKGDQRIPCCGNLTSKWWRVNLGNNFTCVLSKS